MGKLRPVRQWLLWGCQPWLLCAVLPSPATLKCAPWTQPSSLMVLSAPVSYQGLWLGWQPACLLLILGCPHSWAVTGSAPGAQAGAPGGVPLGCKLWGLAVWRVSGCKELSLLLTEEAGGDISRGWYDRSWRGYRFSWALRQGLALRTTRGRGGKQEVWGGRNELGSGADQRRAIWAARQRPQARKSDLAGFASMLWHLLVLWLGSRHPPPRTLSFFILKVLNTALYIHSKQAVESFWSQRRSGFSVRRALHLRSKPSR